MEIPLPQSTHETKFVDLVILLASIEKYDDKRELQTKIYNRVKGKFYDRLHKVISRMYSGFADIETIIDEVFNDAFLLFFQKIPDFKVKEEWGDEECEKVVLYWLSKVANNLILTRYRASKEEIEQFKEYTQFVQLDQLDGDVGRKEYQPTYDMSKVNLVLKALSPMAKEVLYACIDNDTVSEDNTAHLPDRVIQTIAKKYGVTTGALRKAKERALKKIRTCKLENTGYGQG